MLNSSGHNDLVAKKSSSVPNSLAEIREAYLKFFESKGHQRLASSSLIPGDDPTLLFANAGMVQFKDVFIGTDKRSYNRATTSQKCLRISGKHNDLENVGRTARHHTFFEMLGNFSFGDYFKKDAIKFAWEFVTEILKLDKTKLWVTVYEEDEEAKTLWESETDLIKGRVLRFGKKDNFWAMGDTGPCGPCTEIFYYLGENVAGQSEQEFRDTDGLYVEIWNLVFMQFNRSISGDLELLPKPSVDTGMGLERVAAVVQGFSSNYDCDLFKAIIAKSVDISKKNYEGKDYTQRELDPQYLVDVAHRVIADHVRAASFLIADGVMPASDGRGYIIRRLLRRALRHGRVLGITIGFLPLIAEKIIELMGANYPEIKNSSEKILSLIGDEEERFARTYDQGLVLLTKELAALVAKGQKTLNGSFAFTLHDTFGFPLDLTQDIISNKNIKVDEDGYQLAMEQQRSRSRSNRNTSTELILQKAVKAEKTRFVGYDLLEYESIITSIYNQNGEQKIAKIGDEVVVLTAETPFYGESGGQDGDTGSITSSLGAMEVLDTKKIGGETWVHICKVIDGEFTISNRVRLAVDQKRRQTIALNHSATHLIHYALREIVGEHAKQAGSRVADSFLRFDFSNNSSLSYEQLSEIENLVNSEIRKNSQVEIQQLKIDAAKKLGAMALFGEKYGEIVRVVKIGDKSIELCGGTHILRSGEIGFVKIIGDSSVSAGVRRIEALAGNNAVLSVKNLNNTINILSRELNSAPDDLVERFLKQIDRLKLVEKQLLEYKQQDVLSAAEQYFNTAQVLPNGIRVVTVLLKGVESQTIRSLADDLRARAEKVAVVISSDSANNTSNYLVAVSKQLAKCVNANSIITELNVITGSKGGGRADLAQAGGGDPAKNSNAIDKVFSILNAVGF